MTKWHAGVETHPLRRADPPSLGPVQLTARITETDSGMVYAGRLDTADVVVVVLGAGAETDSYARARFVDAVARLRADADGAVVAAEDEPEVAPWVALDAGDGTAIARARATSLLAAVTLADRAPSGTAVGPGFRPHWLRRHGPGRWRVWPLPWPLRLSTASRWTFAAAFALVLAIAALALFIAVLIFRQQNPAPPQPPLPLPTPTQPSQPTPTSPQSPTPSSPTPSVPRPQPTGPGSGTPLPPID